MIDVGWPSLPAQVVLGCIRKRTVQVKGSKPVKSVPPRPLHWFVAPGSCFKFLPSMMDCDFTSQVTFGQHFITATEKKTRKGVKAMKGLTSCPSLRDPATVEVNCKCKDINEHLPGPGIK